ncbi:MAG: large repetitive protein, partial [Acidimicrobiaceae bacterium]|nr:large repetitive protein [Acidimicrobiaceae bacterium]
MNRRPGDPEDLPEVVVSAGRADVTPGRTTDIAIGVMNPGREARSYEIRPVGLDERWAASSLVVGPVDPGQAVEATLPVTLPTGFPACELTAGLAVQPLDAVSGTAVGVATYVDVVFAVGDGSKVTATLEPTDVEGGDGGRFHVVLRNRSRNPLPVDLVASAPSDQLRFRFAQSSVVLPAGHEVRIKTKVRGRRRLTGSPQRLPFVVRVQGRTTPVLLDGSFTQKPTLSGGLTKVTAVVVVIAVWLSLATFGLGKLTNTLHNKNAKAQTAAAPTGGTSAGGGDAAGGGGTGGTTSAAGGGAAGGGAGGAAAKGGAGGAGQVAGAAAVKISGKVTGKDPGGVAVSLAPTSLVDEKAQGASFNGGGPATAKIGKVFGQLVVATAARVVSDTLSTTTANDGSWAFGNVRAPGFYLVTFSKPGFATRKSIVTADDNGKAIELQVPLTAGNGTIGGLIKAGDGAPLGGVDITITDGTVTLGTRTPTTGDVGRWSVTGLTTPGTYLVTSTRRGFGTQTTLVTLAAGQASPDVNLTMQQGTASITGKVTSAEGPVGGAVVTLTNGTITRTASTLTVGSVGSYILPQLPVPAAYSLTVSGEGWTTQTQRIDLTDSASVDTVLTKTTGDVTGVVLGADGKGLIGAGVTLTSDTFKLKTTTVSTPPGSYALTGIPPGPYVLTFEQFGKITQLGAVQVGQGTVGTVNSTLPDGDPNNVPSTARVSGHVVEFRTGAILGNVSVSTTDIDPPKTVTTNGSGDYVITDLPPGVHHLRITSVNHEPVTVTATVGIGGVGFANQAELPADGVINGLVSSNAGGTVANELVQVLTFDTPPAVVASTTTKPDGTYTIGGLTHGHYQISFTGDPSFEHRDLNVPLDVGVAEVKTLPIGLDRRGRLNLNTQTPGADGGLLALGGIQITAVEANGTKHEATTGANGQAANQALLTGLDPGTYDVTFTEPSGAHHTDSVKLNVSLNTTTPYEAVLLGNSDDVSGAVEWTKDGVTLGIANAIVTMTGIVAYDTDSAGHRIPRRQTFVTSTDNAGSFFFPHAKVPLIVETADFNVTAIGFSSQSTTGTKVFGGAVKAFETMVPLP